ncbi:hypothetical protein KDL29_11100 [bacterium]|nr:hypothetical protein [bacterium]
MTNSNNAALELIGPAPRRPLDWLMVYSLEMHNGLDDDWLKASGLDRASAERLLAQHPEYRQEARQLRGLGRLLTLEMLFELLRQRAMEMLAAATKPAELKSLLGTLSGLRALEQRGLEPKLKRQARQPKPQQVPETAPSDSRGLAVMQEADAAAVPDATQAASVEAVDERPEQELPSLPDIAELQGMSPITRHKLVKGFRTSVQELFDADNLPRQQRRQLERIIEKLDKARLQ